MKRHKHTLGHYKLLTGDMGRLYPVGLTEVLPGDAFQHSTNALIRLSPLAAPVMHPVTVRLHHFFVPHRLSWDSNCGQDWEDFITGGPDGADAQTIPQMTSTGVEGDLLDYLGIPPVAGVSISSLPVRCVNLIWNEFYRDQDLAAERQLEEKTVPLIAWEKDYFTTARPWTQKGPEITLPLTGEAPVKVNSPSTTAQNLGIQYTDGMLGMDSSGANLTHGTAGVASNNQLLADLTQASAANVNDVRRAFALQRFAEARARYGSRYTEYLRYLGVTPSDARLRRPEYLGGGRVRVAISEVLQTAPEPTDPRFGVGDLYGHGVAPVRSKPYRRFFNEHGYIVSLLSVRPKAMYTNGINRTWLRLDREDFYQRELEFIGQQPVYNDEIFAVADGTGRDTFGYSDRYREYRENPSCVSGEFRSSLNYWHLGREFTQAPALNESFVQCQPSKRIFNEQTSHSLWMMVQHRMVARRLVSRSAYGKII